MKLNYYLFLLLLFISTLACAQLNIIEHNFNPDSANKTFAKYSQINASNKSSISQLQNATASIAQLQAQAKKCVDENTTNLDKITKRLVEISGGTGKTTPLTSEQKYLNGKKEILTTQLSECQLFILRSDDLLSSLNGKLRALLKNEFLYPEATALDNLLNAPASLKEFAHHFDASLSIEQSGILLLSGRQMVLLALLLVLGIYLGLKTKNILKQNIGEQTETLLPAQCRQAVLSTLHKYIPYIIPTAILAAFLTIAGIAKASYLIYLSYAALGYILLLTLSAFAFYPPKPAHGFSALPESLAKKFTHRISILGGLCFIAYLIYAVFMPQNPPDALHDLVVTAFVTLVTLILIAIVWLVKSLPTMLFHHTLMRLFLSLVLSAGLVTVLITEWLGYHLLSHYLLEGIAFTVLTIFLARLAFKIISVLSIYLAGTQLTWQQNFRAALGLKRNDRMFEIFLFKILLQFIVWCSVLLSLLKIWGLAQTYFHVVLNQLIQGIQIGNFIFIPLRIAIGMLFFIVLAIVTRLLRNYTAKKTNLHLTQGNRDSLAAIVGYIGFAIALLIGLLVAGVDFSGLAIVAGALSVGIGFGLQNIVNNFVSGIILLIERPIKPGDRIIVGDTEGHVRRISIRSTHIITINRTDVIVPNSDLIAKQVTNFMLYDTNFKISTTVGVAYGSDLDLVQKLLLEVAYAHPEVITDISKLAPKVLFRSFGDNSLLFELQCVIKDVEKKLDVTSELNFAIDKAFRQHNIEIAFPKRDIRIVGELGAK